MGSLSSVEDLGVSMFSYGFTLYPQVCLLQWRTVTDRGQAVGHAGPQLDELATCGHGGAGQQQKTGPHLDSETAARGPGPWCSLLWLYSFPRACTLQ